MIWHPKDIEYFRDYPAPIMERLHAEHFTNINATIPFFGPMLYFLVRAFRAQKVLEVGTSFGYTSYYLASAVKDNQTRYGFADVMFYGLDIIKTKEVREQLDKLGLPNTIIPLDSAKLTSETFPNTTFDLIFQDGNHETPYVLHEFEVLWPQLRSDGRGYWVGHDSLGPAEEAYQERLLPRLKQEGHEFVTLDDDVYGMTIIRKLSEYKKRKHWTA